MTQGAAHWLCHEGISAARLRVVYKGRPASIDAAKVAALKAEGLGATEIAPSAARRKPRGDDLVRDCASRSDASPLGRTQVLDTEGPSGRRTEDWTGRKELLFPDAGIVVTGRAGETPAWVHRIRMAAPLLTQRRAPFLSPTPRRSLAPRPIPRGAVLLVLCSYSVLIGPLSSGSARRSKAHAGRFPRPRRLHRVRHSV
jgi:hypothetical protein